MAIIRPVCISDQLFEKKRGMLEKNGITSKRHYISVEWSISESDIE